MKKLLAILVILLLAAPLFAGTDILNFMWFNNKIGFAISDRANPASATIGEGNGVDGNNISTGSGINYYNFIEQFMCGMWGTIYEGDNITVRMDFFNYFSCEMGDFCSLNNATLQLNEQIQFKTILDIGSIYSLALGGKGYTRMFPLDTAGASPARWGFMGVNFIWENTIKIPNIMNIALNTALGVHQWGDGQSWARGPHGDAIHTDMYIYLTAALNGSYSFGFSWSLTQDIILKLDLENAHGNIINPTSDLNGDGTIDYAGDTDIDGGIMGSGAQPAYFSNTPFFATTLMLSQEVLGLAGVENVTLTISLAEKLLIQAPYSVYSEQTKLINTQGKWGLTLGLYGLSFGLFMTLATQDSYNTTMPMKGYAGSSQAGADGIVGTNDDTGYWGGSGRNPGRAQLGVMLTFGYSRGFFGFEMSYHGQAQIRDYDMDRDNFVGALDNDSNLTADNGGLYRIDLKYYRWSNLVMCSINFSW